MADSHPSVSLDTWRQKGIGVLRIIFGLVWAVDAWFKWQPDFIGKFTDYIQGAIEGQSSAVQAWLGFWVNVVKVDPTLFAYAVAIAETAVAVSLILGLFSNVAGVGGILLSLVIWSTAEAFGGPYKAGTTDIGAAIIYALVFTGLFFARSGLFLGLDKRLAPVLGKWSFLGSGRLP
jgi:uncharacterized membrane protein YphA (DoxX/SURF4 family)